MLLCLSDGEDVSPVLEYCDRRGLYAEYISIGDYPNIKTALSKYRATANYDFILFYFTARTIPEEDLIESASFILKFYHARIIVFAPSGAGTSQLFGALFDMGLRELVDYNDTTDLGAELEQCLSMDGKGYAEAVQVGITAQIETAWAYIRPILDIPEGLRLTIAIAGAQHRIGVTTQAFSMYHALVALGFTPCIVDVEQSFIESLMMVYEDETEAEGSIVHIQGMDFSHDIQVGTGHNVFLYDLGVLHEAAAEIFRDCSLRVLCAGTKAWELPLLAEKLGTYRDDIQMIVFSFASKSEEKRIGAMEIGSYTTAYAPWNPDIWEHGNKEWYERLLVPLLKERLSP